MVIILHVKEYFFDRKQVKHLAPLVVCINAIVDRRLSRIVLE